MIDRTALTTALTSQVAVVVDDLRVRADRAAEVSEFVTDEWRTAVAADRTARDLETWREDLLSQVAVSWVLGCVFIRFCEDNRLLTEPLLSGTGTGRRWAGDAQVEFFRNNPEAGERRYLEHVFKHAAGVNGLAEVFGAHNPVWMFGPSDDACRALIEVWRSSDPETGELVWDFTDSEWDTRFLGDLYQDLSEHAKKTYALLQTPDFVEGFILDRTLDPALEEFGLDGHDGTGFRMIDPACGSGHFLLGGFRRLAERQLTKDPGAGPRAAAARALGNVFGVDLNPCAASIARFRLLLAALRFAAVGTLAEAPKFTINVAVGDSLLHGARRQNSLPGVSESAERQAQTFRHLYETEDAETVGQILRQKYHAVVANPPYITPKDPAANQAYRGLYKACSGKYSLAVPFMERLFDLALRGAGRPAGYVGQITAKSFMTQQFGKKLVEQYLAKEIDLTHVIDTSGVAIPGHGTPTVILLGRNRLPLAGRLRLVFGISGEPGTPADGGRGLVWTSILDLLDQPGSENDYVSVADVERCTLASHPWSLQGGAAASLKQLIEASRPRLETVIVKLGFAAIPGTDDAFLLKEGVSRRMKISHVRPCVGGKIVRDYGLSAPTPALFPYSSRRELVAASDLPGPDLRWLWPREAVLGSCKWFGKDKWESGTPWHSWAFVAKKNLETPLSIVFAYVATHNHFVLDRGGGGVFTQSAPLIKLDAAAATEDDHLGLLGSLNSALACFWMKQVFHNKGGTTNSQGAKVSGTEAWLDYYGHGCRELKQFPLASGSLLDLAKALDALARELALVLPAAVCDSAVPTRSRFESSQRQAARLRLRMVWLQEELDWRAMFLYGVTDTDLSFSPADGFELSKGERAFEIALARRVEQGSTESTWFERHASTPLTKLPERWPHWYQQRVEQRLELIETDRFVNLLERPEYKRRWNWEPWEDLASEALEGWLLERLEDDRLWSAQEPRSVAQLADAVHFDSEFVQVAKLYRGEPEVDLVKLVTELTTADAVPYLSAWRYKEPGLRKRAAWERTWELQRRQDSGADVGRIPVPPNYVSADFTSKVAWKLRGKLDVAKERFISYPGTERAADTTPVLGWAGWDHLAQANALAAMMSQRSQTEGWDAEQLTPLLAGLAELVPWLQQWHNDYDPALGQGLGGHFADYLASETQRHGLSPEDLSDWRPPKQIRRSRNK